MTVPIFPVVRVIEEVFRFMWRVERKERKMTVDRESMKEWVAEAIEELGGKGRIVEICKEVWEKHGDEIMLLATCFTNGNMRFAGRRTAFVKTVCFGLLTNLQMVCGNLHEWKGHIAGCGGRASVKGLSWRGLRVLEASCTWD